MKKLLLILLCLPIIGFGQNVNIPDANFKAYLVGNSLINTNGDTEIQVSEATAFNGTIHCPSINISDLTGIEDFTALTQLRCEYNQLTSLDVSANTALWDLGCYDNQLTSLDVSQNTALTSLDCQYNQITSLDVSGATALTYLECGNNQLTSLDVSGATALTHLDCGNNQLTSLDVSNNTALTWLECPFNQLTSFDVSNNTALTDLRCGSNLLTSLDVRNGNNINFINLYATNNPNLYCIDVDDPTWSTANWTQIDSWTSFSSNCATAFGCTDSLACNYDSLAAIDDGSCGYNNASYDTLSVTASIIWNGIPLNASGDYSVTLINSAGCDSIANLNLTITNPSGILNVTHTEKTLLKITDMLGQETPYRRNTPLFYIYDEGTVEKKIVIE